MVEVMLSIYIIGLLTIVLMTLSFFLFPKIKMGKKFSIDTYWVVTLSGALLILLINYSIAGDILSLFIENNSTNPFKIIVLFLSLTFISKFLDNVGLFNYLATRASRIGKGNQLIIFTAFYFLISLLTILTNNDIIIIVTPIMIYFAKAAKVKPLPYLIMVCFVLNTLSTTFLTTNVSNLYLASFFGITYFDYFLKLTPVSLILMVVLYLLLIIIFYKDLKVKIEVEVEKEAIKNKFLLVIGLFSLSATTILLIVSNLINIEMYLITLLFALFDLIIAISYCFIKKEDKGYFIKPIKTLPYEFIPFLVSMFVIISSLNQTPLLKDIGALINSIESTELETLTYGLTSALSANLVNNVPMALLYGNILNSGSLTSLNNVYSVILASNLCALITPCGALSSLMFMRICKENRVEITYLDYLKFAPLGVILLFIGIGLIIVL